MRIAMISRRYAQGLMLAASAIMLVPGAASAQEAWPKAKPIRVIIPFGVGSATDIIARIVMDEVGRSLGQTVVPENKVGAAGTIASAAVAKADPDGYTVLVHSSSHTVTPNTFSKLTYDTEKDLAGVLPLANIPIVVVTSAKNGHKSLGDLVKAGLAKPGSMNFASAGAGSATHLACERLKIATKLQAAHFATKGSSDALTEILGQRVDFYCSPIDAAISLIKDGQVTALAVSSAKRASSLPNVPTTVEAGYADSGYAFWVGAFLPRATPADIRKRLHAELVKAIKSPAIAKKFADLGAEPLTISPEEFDAMVKAEIATNAGLVKAAGVKVN
jgi:tripartite-type tricarboxylate transporter receptor subunit TctC